MRKKMLSLVMATGMLATLLSGCGNESNTGNAPEAENADISVEAEVDGEIEETAEKTPEDKIVLKASVMANEEEKKIFENAIARFEEAHPEYSVEASYTSGSTWGEYCDKLLIQIGSGEAPDVIHVAIEEIGRAHV